MSRKEKFQEHIREFLKDPLITVYELNELYIDSGKLLMDGEQGLLVRMRFGTNGNHIHGITECVVSIREVYSSDAGKTRNGMLNKSIMQLASDRGIVFQRCASQVPGSEILKDHTFKNDSSGSLKSMCDIISGHYKKMMPILVKVRMREKTLNS